MKNVLSLQIIIGGLACLVIAGAFLYTDSIRYAGSYSDTDPTFNKAFWEGEIHANGAQRAYTEFLQKNAEPNDRQHFSAHVIGGLIFDAEGAKGVVVCDSSFGFGCYHGFFARAISREGTDYIREVNAICIESYGTLGTGCQHGIGHGILEYVGYQKITEALELCKSSAPQQVPLLGCTSGVFMEYFAPLEGTDDALLPGSREIDPAHPFVPCDTTVKEFQGSCYYELGQHMVDVPLETPLVTCKKLSGSAREHCFLGVGTELAYQGENADIVFSACTSLQDADALACRAGASWAFFTLKTHTADSKRMCDYGDVVEKTRCQKLADLTEGADVSVLPQL